ncbi:polyprenol monophosphomannose synthase [Aquimarina agarilytica]|uniref:polyprenol monophosphomannose synthase n=1 Tax=Aquimarina agarilytica TaxID=1087449 RepID=UPI000287E533|nr:polyprenol monophosphomannose synthase [Aquimarina agarilytica]
MPKPLVIVPTYNEIENIELLVEAVFQLPIAFDLLIVDDNSPDGTANAINELIKKYPNKLFLESRKGKLGLGTAYIHGFKWALNRNYDYIFEMDADFSHNPNDLVKLYQTATSENMDMVIGSRYIKGVNVVNWPMSRVLLSYGASKYVQFITGMPICDTTAGFVCYSRNLLEQINLNNIKFVGYAFQIEMKFKAYLKKCAYKEIPVIFTDRTRGNSKMSKGIISEAIFGVIQMKLNSIFNKK